MVVDSVATTVVDLKPLIDAVIGVLASLVLAFGVVAVRKMNSWLAVKTGQQNLINEGMVRDYLHRALENGVKYAVTRVGTSDWSNVHVKNELTAEALRYATGRVPDAIKHFNLSEEDLQIMIESKLATLDPLLGVSAPAAASQTGTVATASINVEPTPAA